MKARLPFLHAAEWLSNEVLIADERRILSQLRAGRPLCYEDEDQDQPLVTVRVATYGTGRTVVDRAIRSALAQTHENVEVLVIGDRCGQDTVEAIAEVDDHRLRFLNLGERSNYPQLPHLRRKVAGALPMTVGNLLAKGRWIAPCDDDDELTPDSIEVRLAAARERRLEMIYGTAENESSPGVWEIVGREPMARGHVSHGAVLLRSELRFMPYSMTSWKRREPSDWNLWNRMRRIGVRTGFVDHVAYRHHLSQAGRTRAGRDASPGASASEIATS